MQNGQQEDARIVGMW